EYDPETDKLIFKRLLKDGMSLPESKNKEVFVYLSENDDIEEYINTLYSDSFINDSEEFLTKLHNEDLTLDDVDDPFITLAEKFYDLDKAETVKRNKINGQLNILLANMMEVKRIWLEKSFIPDANSTLR